MPVHSARAAATGGSKERRPTVSFGLSASAIALMLAGCAAPPASSLAAAADPNAPVPATRYSSVTAPYKPQRPVEPQPWRERNEGVAPRGVR